MRIGDDKMETKTKAETQYHYLKNAGIGILVLLSYFILPLLSELPFAIANVNINTIPLWAKVVYMIFFETIILLIIVLLLKDKLKKDFYDLKENHQTYFKDCLKYWLIALGVMMFSNLLINANSANGISDNQKILQETFKISPLYIFFSSVIWAPIVEELTFRQAIRNIIKPTILFILVSGLLFGGMHVLASYSSLKEIWAKPMELLYIIPYSAPGFAFAYMLQKYDNTFISIGFHLMHNGILMALQFFLYFFS